ncbi:RodZ domain-containing protein [Andreprevotia chitinilytica]|uniref:RodZ domain-containing protein n=1 Tax=Andreprevotia chitinilytica TaxID=396808 RepID=UPI0005501FCF|nr:RodZ domain-containing protein [Andreprevotia chitinilytica]
MNHPEQEATAGRADIPSVGARLKARREQLGLTLEQAAQQLKLTRTQVNAIERDEFGSLPGNTFARGFVRNYARLLQIDPEPILADLVATLPAERVQTALPKVQEEAAFSMGSVGGGTTGRRIQLILGALIGLIISGGGAFWYLQQPASPSLDVPEVASSAVAASSVVADIASEAVAISDEEVKASSPASSVVVMAAASAVASSVSAKVAASVPATISASVAKAASVASGVKSAPIASAVKSAAASSVVGNGEVRIVAEADSWVQVFDGNGNKLISEIVKQGESRSVGGKPPYRLKIGNAPKTRLYLRGQAIDLTGYTKTDVATLELK